MQWEGSFKGKRGEIFKVTSKFYHFFVGQKEILKKNKKEPLNFHELFCSTEKGKF